MPEVLHVAFKRPEGVTCEHELGRWTIRVNGLFLIDFWRETPARRLAMRLQHVLKN